MLKVHKISFLLSTGKQYDIKNMVNQWDIVIVRLFKVGDKCQILGYYCNMPSSIKLDVMSLVNKYMSDYRRKHKIWTIKQFLKDNSLKIAIIPEKLNNAHKVPKQEDDVKRLLIKNMGDFYSKIQLREAIYLRNDFSKYNKKYISKPEKWAAAIEYLVSRLDLRDITKETIAEKYGVSLRIVISRSNIIDSALTIRFQLVLAYLLRLRWRILALSFVIKIENTFW